MAMSVVNVPAAVEWPYWIGAAGPIAALFMGSFELLPRSRLSVRLIAFGLLCGMAFGWLVPFGSAVDGVGRFMLAMGVAGVSGVVMLFSHAFVDSVFGNRADCFRAAYGREEG
jgi:hypothetical protein